MNKSSRVRSSWASGWPYQNFVCPRGAMWQPMIGPHGTLPLVHINQSQSNQIWPPNRWTRRCQVSTPGCSVHAQSPCWLHCMVTQSVAQLADLLIFLIIEPNDQNAITWAYSVRLRWNERLWIQNDEHIHLMLVLGLYGHFHFWAKIWSPNHTSPLWTFGLQKFTSLVNKTRLKLKITQKFNPKCLIFNWCPWSPNQGTSHIFFVKTYYPLKNRAKKNYRWYRKKTLMSGIWTFYLISYFL